MKYQFVTHLEESAVEWNFLLEKLKVAGVTYIPGKYEWSPATKDEAQWHTIPRCGLIEIFSFKNTFVNAAFGNSKSHGCRKTQI